MVPKLMQATRNTVIIFFIVFRFFGYAIVVTKYEPSDVKSTEPDC